MIGIALRTLYKIPITLLQWLKFACSSWCFALFSSDIQPTVDAPFEEIISCSGFLNFKSVSQLFKSIPLIREKIKRWQKSRAKDTKEDKEKNKRERIGRI